MAINERTVALPAQRPHGGGRLQAAISAIQTAGITPLDPLHLTAQFEMDGWNDAAARDVGFEDLFELGRVLYPRLAAAPIEARERQAARHEAPFIAAVKLGLAFLRGAVFAMPMVVSAAASLILGLSLWSYAGFGLADATGIAIATIASFLATGGFTQAMARRGLFFLSMNEFRLARTTAQQITFFGVAVAAALGLVFLAVLLVVPLLGPGTVLMAVIYYP
ncbi:MAG: hypothetical protein WCI21_05485, partial [Alphaproteobacteria bacterium]